MQKKEHWIKDIKGKIKSDYVIFFFIVLAVVVASRYYREWKWKDVESKCRNLQVIDVMVEELEDFETRLTMLSSLQGEFRFMDGMIETEALHGYAYATDQMEEVYQWSDLQYRYGQFEDALSKMLADEQLDAIEKEYVQEVYAFNHQVLQFVRESKLYPERGKQSSSLSRKEITESYEELEKKITQLYGEHQHSFSRIFQKWNDQYYMTIDDAKAIALDYGKRVFDYDDRHMVVSSMGADCGSYYFHLEKRIDGDPKQSYSVDLSMEDNWITLIKFFDSEEESSNADTAIDDSLQDKVAKQKADQVLAKLDRLGKKYTVKEHTIKQEQKSKDQVQTKRFYYIAQRDGLSDRNSEIVIIAQANKINQVRLHLPPKSLEDQGEWIAPEKIRDQLTEENKAIPIDRLYDPQGNKAYHCYFERDGQIYEGIFDGVTGKILSFEKVDQDALSN